MAKIKYSFTVEVTVNFDQNEAPTMGCRERVGRETRENLTRAIQDWKREEPLVEAFDVRLVRSPAGFTLDRPRTAEEQKQAFGGSLDRSRARCPSLQPETRPGEDHWFVVGDVNGPGGVAFLSPFWVTEDLWDKLKLFCKREANLSPAQVAARTKHPFSGVSTTLWKFTVPRPHPTDTPYCPTPEIQDWMVYDWGFQGGMTDLYRPWTRDEIDHYVKAKFP